MILSPSALFYHTYSIKDAESEKHNAEDSRNIKDGMEGSSEGGGNRYLYSDMCFAHNVTTNIRASCRWYPGEQKVFHPTGNLVCFFANDMALSRPDAG